MPVYSDKFNYTSLVSAVPDIQPVTTFDSSSSLQCAHFNAHPINSPATNPNSITSSKPKLQTDQEYQSRTVCEVGVSVDLQKYH